MSETAENDLVVSIQELPEVDVVCAGCTMDVPAGDFEDRIALGFQEIKALATRHGHDPASHKVIGVPHVADGRLVGYECCAEVPTSTRTSDVSNKRLAGGRYAVLTLEKNPATIGASIGRFFSEYVPGHRLQIDTARPGYEVYLDNVMELCTPIC